MAVEQFVSKTLELLQEEREAEIEETRYVKQDPHRGTSLYKAGKPAKWSKMKQWLLGILAPGMVEAGFPKLPIMPIEPLVIMQKKRLGDI